MTPIEIAKERLPLPSLLEKLDLGEHAKRSARCPLHKDRHPSFSTFRSTNGDWRFKCHAGCGEGDEIRFLELLKGIARSDAIKLYLEMAEITSGNGTQVPPQKSNASHSELVDWQSCVEAFTDKHVERLAKWRGYSVEFCRRLRDRGFVGVWKGCIAFPVHGEDGEVVGVHYRSNSDGRWFYTQGCTARPLIIGTSGQAKYVHIFESQWDAFAVMDKFEGDELGLVIITRGAGNGALVAGQIPTGAAHVFAWKQNDAEKNGKYAADEWLKDVCAHAGVSVRGVQTPLKFKDPNDWTKTGRAGFDQIIQALIETKLVVADSASGTNRRHSLNSINSQLLPFALREDYPKALPPEAFYGLAGEIVRRIEPHTEADPAALLFQLLTAFGNLIRHDHYFVADGTRHYLNLYGVLVGQSSKGRKGTSWNHIANILELVDPEWREGRVSFGLSSGEGLIWAVRDPIEETKPIREKGRYTGEYETYIANHGEADKRLFVIEGEFANVLKVMAREGNTLSPVIRSAWDSGNLKTMVKNSPAKATNAHISIVGHITRDELRRLLTQTESANGFANRFCWLAVKRSKCLPEGGAIQTVNFDRVITDLQSAADFVKDFVEIFRDSEAKKLWRDVYADLSEGKPGMLGAITGRAEAQVMRLSAIYALLDKSQLIRPEHHNAAMAMWKYCEESARWIFGTSTGDRNADRILAALRHAPNDMTKTEISSEVFNRHASSADIDEALRLLHGLKMASYRTESSGGAPIQCWFFVGETREKSE
jgi:hypothetical protein